MVIFHSYVSHYQSVMGNDRETIGKWWLNGILNGIYNWPGNFYGNGVKKVFNGIIVDEYHDHGRRLGYSWIRLVMTITVCELENHVML